MIPYNFTYLFAGGLHLLVWVFLYWHRKDVRKEMWLVSLSVMTISVIAEYYMWTVDYWYPSHVWGGGRIGAEDFLISFTQGGIAAVIYEEIFRKRLYKRDKNLHNLGFLFFTVLPMTVIAFLFFGLKMYSFNVWNLVMLGVVIALALVRKDLFQVCLFSGITFLVSLWPIYWLTSYVSPGWIDKFWFLDNLSGYRFLSIPWEDHIFYFLVGAIMGPFYEYWQGARLRRLPLNKS